MKNERGFSMLESMAFMMAFVILAAYAIDFFTIVHTGILNSTSARAYAFETFQHRSNLAWMRQADEVPGKTSNLNFATQHFRFHATEDEGQTDHVGADATGRYITQADPTLRQMNDTRPESKQNQNQTSLVHIRTGYGICLDANCGGTP